MANMDRMKSSQIEEAPYDVIKNIPERYVACHNVYTYSRSACVDTCSVGKFHQSNCEIFKMRANIVLNAYVLCVEDSIFGSRFHT